MFKGYENDMEYIKVIELKNIFKWDEILNQPDRAKDFFLNNNEEVVYIREEGELKGLVTPGDILRYYTEGKTEFKPNTRYTFLEKIDFNEAKKITDRFITINEVPVVVNGTFEGIIKKKRQRSSENWLKYKKNLLNIEEDLFFIDVLNKWKNIVMRRYSFIIIRKIFRHI